MSLQKLEKDFSEYYSTEFLSDNDDRKANVNLRNKAVGALKLALDNGNTTLANEIVELLASNTGCQEDIELFVKLASPLREKNLLSEALYNKVLSKGESRWV